MLTIGLSIIISYGFYRLSHSILERKNDTDSANNEKYSVWVAVLVFILIYYGSGYFGFKKPGMVFERNSYQTEVELEVKRNGNKFIVSGTIESGIGKVQTENVRYYSLKFFDLPDGRRISFKEAYENGEGLRLESFVRIRDDQDKYWQIKLQPALKHYLWMNR